MQTFTRWYADVHPVKGHWKQSALCDDSVVGSFLGAPNGVVWRSLLGTTWIDTIRTWIKRIVYMLTSLYLSLCVMYIYIYNIWVFKAYLHVYMIDKSFITWYNTVHTNLQLASHFTLKCWALRPSSAPGRILVQLQSHHQWARLGHKLPSKRLTSAQRNLQFLPRSSVCPTGVLVSVERM